MKCSDQGENLGNDIIIGWWFVASDISNIGQTTLAILDYT